MMHPQRRLEHLAGCNWSEQAALQRHCLQLLHLMDDLASHHRRFKSTQVSNTLSNALWDFMIALSRPTVKGESVTRPLLWVVSCPVMLGGNECFIVCLLMKLHVILPFFLVDAWSDVRWVAPFHHEHGVKQASTGLQRIHFLFEDFEILGNKCFSKMQDQREDQQRL